jgi:hypothetical protein
MAQRPVVFLALACAAFAQESIQLKPFSIDHRAADSSVIDLSWLHDAPAGRDGFIQIRAGHLATPHGKRFRIWGVNLTAFAAGSVHIPAKDDAAFWAGTLSRLGVNCVRLHFLDEPAPNGILAADRDETRAFDAEQLDRLDFFITELKKRGIYCDLNLNVGHTYKAGDGVRDYQLIGTGKALTYFDPRLIELQKDYARQLLTHINPYTKSEYRHEPAIAIIEIVNENSIVAAWERGRLRGLKTTGPPENWQDITPYYEQELTRLFKGPRLQPGQFASASKERFETELSFYMQLESNFFRDMKSYLKDTLGSKSLLIGTSDYTYGLSSYPLLSSTSQLDIIDGHGPWELRPMVSEPLNSIVVRLSRSAVAGKPFIVSEHNHRFPGDYTSEGIPLLAAYAGLQDWDGVMLYTFEPKQRFYVPYNGTRADLSHDPVKIPNLAAGALMFLRQDVDPARETILRTYSREQVLESSRLPSSEAVYFTPGFSVSAALRHESRIASLNGSPTQKLHYDDTSPIGSDTHQLAWYFTPHTGPATGETDQKFSDLIGSAKGTALTGMVTVDTPRTQALIGFLPQYPKSVSHLSAAIRNTFATLVLTSLNSQPIVQSRDLLLTAGSRVTNTGKGPPTQIEPVTGMIVLRNLGGVTGVLVWPLDGARRRMAQPLRAHPIGEAWEVTVGDPATTWYEVIPLR